MKLVSFVLLMASMAFLVSGCSDEPGPVASPTGQIASAPGSLAKNIQREFTATYSPTGNPVWGRIKTADGKTLIRGELDTIQFVATFSDGGVDLLTGKGVVEWNATIDNDESVGEFWGTLTLTPDAPEAEGGVWKMTWHGKGTFPRYGYTVPLKEVGHGAGGAIEGMQVFFDNIIMLPGDMPGWWVEAQGYIKGH